MVGRRKKDSNFLAEREREGERERESLCTRTIPFSSKLREQSLSHMTLRDRRGGGG
jgi:hypothetical protein